MREIKFRGISKNNNRWVYGFVSIDKNSAKMEGFPHYISRSSGYLPVEVIPKSVGQYTGQYDPTATEFCEGDIIKDHTDYWEVKFFDGAFWIVAIGGNAEPELLCGNDYMEIIGNRYENPELLKEG